MQKDTLASLENNTGGLGRKLTAGHARQLRYDARIGESKAKPCSRPRVVLINAISKVTESISEACMALLTEAGHRVVIVIGDECISQTLADAIATGKAAALPRRVTGAAGMQRAVKSLPLPFRAIDAVVNINQLPARRTGLLGADQPYAEADPGTSTGNLLNTIRAALPGLLASGRGQVITVTLNGPDNGIAGDGHADTLCTALRSELDDLGIRFAHIAAGPMEGQASADSHGTRPRSNGVPHGTLVPTNVAQAIAWTLAQPDHVAVSDIVLCPAPRGQPALSPREREVLEWTACGKTSEEISCILELSVSAVNFHVKNLVLKLQCCNKTAAVARAALLGMLV